MAGHHLHVLYLHQYFATRAGYTGTRSYEFSKFLIGRGHRVTMITSGINNTDPMNVPRGRTYIEVDIEGIRVVPIAAGYNNPLPGTGMGGIARMRAFLQFASLATRVGNLMERPDVVFATHTPLPIGLAGMKLSGRFGVPFVFEVRDLWPEALVHIGALRNPLAIWWLRRMARKIYRAADHIVALSPGMKAGVVRAGIPDEKVTVITNASDLGLFRPDVDGSAARERLGIGDRFAAVYFGAMGLANGLEYAVEAARVLRDRRNDQIVIVLHGDGGRRKELERLVKEYKLDNVIFSDLVPDKAAVAEIVAACNVCMTIYARTDKEQTWSPNKMFDALAAGRPVLINVPGWLGETIEQNRCGRFVDPHRPQALADALQQLATDPDLCSKIGRNARALAEREFSRDTLAARLEQVLLRSVKRTG